MNISSKTALAALAVAFMSVSGGARASMIYDVNASDGTEAVNGTITTDGNTGTLVLADITAWNLTVSGTSPLPAPFTITSADSGAQIGCTNGVGGGCADASASQLSWAFPHSVIMADVVGSVITGEVVFTASSIDFGGLGCSNSVCYVLDGAPTAEAQVATSAVPEPSSLSILAAGLGALGFGWVRRRRNDV